MSPLLLIFKFKKLAKLIILLLIYVTWSVQAANLSWLENQEKIRVYISNAPGMGHQAASSVVMRRLRQLGFNGQFEVIYNNSIANKLPILFPGFDPTISSNQYLAKYKINAISENDFFKSTNHQIIDLAITGADDNRSHLTPNKLFTKNYLLLEPQGWGDSLYFSNSNSTPVVLNQIRNLGYHFEVDTSSESIGHALESLSLNSVFTNKTHGLSKVLNTNAHMSAIYGIGLIPNMPERIKIWIQGIQMAERSLKLKKPILIPIISPLNEYELLNLNWEIKSLMEKSKKRIIFADIHDVDFNAKIDHLKAGEIIVFHVGKVPQDLFEILFAKSDLPLLVAGKNAMNLAQLLGKSYLNTVNDLGLESKETPPEIYAKIFQAHEIFYKSKYDDKYIRKLSNFIKESYQGDSDLNNFFKSIAAIQRDKVAEALDLIGLSYRKQLNQLTCSQIFN